MKSDIANIQVDMRELRGGMKAANDSIAGLKGAISALDAKVDARISGLETKIIKWIITTVLASAGLAFSIAKFVT